LKIPKGYFICHTPVANFFVDTVLRSAAIYGKFDF